MTHTSVKRQWYALIIAYFHVNRNLIFDNGPNLESRFYQNYKKKNLWVHFLSFEKKTNIYDPSTWHILIAEEAELIYLIKHLNITF